MLTRPQSTPARLTAIATVKPPRLALFALCLAYIVFGLFERDPWKTDDVVWLATMLSALDLGGSAWLTPQVGPMAFAQDGPLVMWTGAGLIRILGPWIGDIAASRVTNLVWFCITLWSMWYGTYLLGRRPEAQPLALPFGGEPTVKDYGRMLADAALLLLLATVGILIRLHETSVVPAIIAWQALAYYALARMLDKPLQGSITLGVALACAFLTRAWPGTLPILLAVPLAFRPGSALWPSRRWMLLSLLLALALGLAWWLPSKRLNPDWMNAWAIWNASFFGVPDLDAVLRPMRDLPWFLWPTWPLALLALWQWRRWINAPHIWIPLAFVLGVMLMLPVTTEHSEAEYVQLAVPLAVLAAFALPTMRRGVVNTLDWFALMCYSVTITCAWLGWIALHFGIPRQISINIGRQTVGFEPHIVWSAVVAGLFVTLAWVALVLWRVRVRPTVLWRGSMLCAAGITMTWVLLVLLWMPALDYVRSYRPMSAQLRTVLTELEHAIGGPVCVRAQGLSLGPRASLYVFDKITFTYDSTCPYALQLTSKQQLEDGSAGYSEGATVLWQGSRGADRFDRFRLLHIGGK